MNYTYISAYIHLVKIVLFLVNRTINGVISQEEGLILAA